tara:strand:- start:2570 stop:4102 length:1533 start_codon:yes stop_codon:yes gene_type:complete
METAQGTYERWQGLRETYLERARDASKLTIPTLIPQAGLTSSTKFPTPFQSVGSRGVNNLANALNISLLPPNAPFFRLILDGKAKQEIENSSDIKGEIEDALSKIEREVMREVEANNFRIGTFEALKHLIVSGNALIYIPKEGGMRVFHLDRYVVKRDPMGNVERIIIKEEIAKSQAPEEALLGDNPSDVDTISLYTSITTLHTKKIEVYQEIGGIRLEDSYGTFDKDKCPYRALRLNRVDGEDYGRGYVEEYMGDLESLEGLTQAIVEGSAASAKLLFMVAPNGVTRKSRIAQASNGAIIEGMAGDVTTLQTQKHADFRVAFETINQISERLNYAFMLTESAIRKAERVTAEEVRLVTQAIERQLGGIYSVLSQEFQLPLVKILMTRMTADKKIPSLPKGFVQPVVVTGVEALGRGQDLNKLDSFIAGIGQVLGPETVQQYVNISEYLKRRAASLGLDTDGLIKTEEQLQAEAQQAQQAQMTSQLGPNAVNAMGSYANEQLKQQAQEGA